MLSCPVCSKQFENPQKLGGHVSSHNRSSAYKKGRRKNPININHECKFCGVRFDKGFLLGSHVPYCAKNPNYEENKRKFKYDFTGKHHSEKTKEILRQKGGYRKGSGRGKQGWYHGYWCDSSWELAWVIFHIDHGIDFERNLSGFSYVHDGRTYNYYPDFKIGEQYYEIKGYLTDKDKSKFKAFPHELEVLTYTKMKTFLEYVKNKYGNDFISLYEGR